MGFVVGHTYQRIDDKWTVCVDNSSHMAYFAACEGDNQSITTNHKDTRCWLYYFDGRFVGSDHDYPLSLKVPFVSFGTGGSQKEKVQQKEDLWTL